MMQHNMLHNTKSLHTNMEDGKFEIPIKTRIINFRASSLNPWQNYLFCTILEKDRSFPEVTHSCFQKLANFRIVSVPQFSTFSLNPPRNENYK